MRQDIKERIEMINRGEMPEGYKKTFLGITSKNYKIYELEKVADRILVGLATSVTEFYRNNGVPIIRNQNIKENKFNDYDMLYLDRNFADSQKNKTVKTDDVIVVRTGSNLGLACIVPKEYNNSHTFTTLIITCKDKVLEPHFLMSYINSDIGKREINRLQVGAGKNNLNVGDLQRFNIIMPNYKEQQKISIIISLWNYAIELKEKLLEQKRLQKKGIINDLLIGKIRLKEFDTCLQGQIKERFETIRHGKVPEGYKREKNFIIPIVWKFQRINEIAEQVSEINIENKDYTVLSCTKYDGLVDSLSYFKKQVYSDDLSTYKIVRKGFIVYATNHIEEGSIGLQNVADVGLVSPMYTVFKVKDDIINNNYLFTLLKTENMRRIFETMMSASVDRRGSLRWNDFSQIKVPVPPLKEQLEICAVIQTMEKEIELIELELEQIKLQKKGLMQLLLTGMVRVAS